MALNLPATKVRRSASERNYLISPTLTAANALAAPPDAAVPDHAPDWPLLGHAPYEEHFGVVKPIGNFEPSED
jgi:hypothetical protein